MTFPKKVFVYGTLKRGHGNHRLMRGAHFIGEGYSTGWTMLHLGSFPGIIPNDSDSKVHGEIYEVSDPDIIRRLDQLEGVQYDKNGESVGLYHRKHTHVCDTTNDRNYSECLVYEFNHDWHDEEQVIEDGQWVA